MFPPRRLRSDLPTLGRITTDYDLIRVSSDHCSFSASLILHTLDVISHRLPPVAICSSSFGAPLLFAHWSPPAAMVIRRLLWAQSLDVEGICLSATTSLPQIYMSEAFAVEDLFRLDLDLIEIPPLLPLCSYEGREKNHCCRSFRTKEERDKNRAVGLLISLWILFFGWPG